jgi:hypothetical protein
MTIITTGQRTARNVISDKETKWTSGVQFSGAAETFSLEDVCLL